MKTITRLSAAMVLLLICAMASISQPSPEVFLSAPIRGFTGPVQVTHAGDGSGRLFVIDTTARIRIVKGGVVMNTPFLDFSELVTCGDRGYSSVAFPPDYVTKGYFYLKYQASCGETVVSRFQVTTDPDIADPNSEQIVLTVSAPLGTTSFAHFGGALTFGPGDGYLYVSIGECNGDTQADNPAQKPGELCGKMLRIDVETGSPVTYTIPGTNPFINVPGFRPEIWALGFRNPWRFSFDRMTGDLYIGDVGEGAFEEINFQSASSTGGENYGWRIMEGANCFRTATCDTLGLTLPVAGYDHTEGCSITGGYVYRGADFPSFQGIYFFGDFCTGGIWALKRENDLWQRTLVLDTDLELVSFGEDEAGNIYVAGINGDAIYMLTDTAPALPHDLSIAKTGTSDTVLVGDNLTYTVTVTNHNPTDSATNVVVTDVLPSSLTFVSATPSQGACSGTSAIVCNLGEIAGGATANVSIVATPSIAGTITNTASVHGNEIEPDTTNNQATHSARVVRLSSLNISSSAAGCLTITGKLTLSGPAPSVGAVVSLANTNPAVTVPVNVTVPAGATSQTFPITTAMVSAPLSGTLTATFNSVSLSRTLKVKPTRAQSLALAPNPVVGGNSAIGTITLKCAAAPGGVLVLLSSGNTAIATVPASITIPAGETVGNFTMNTVAVTRRYAPTIRTKIGGTSLRANLIVDP